MTIEQKIRNCFSISQLDLLRGEILKDADNFAKNQKLFIAQQKAINASKKKANAVVTDFRYHSYYYKLPRGKGEGHATDFEVCFFGFYWIIRPEENPIKGRALEMDDTNLFEEKKWRVKYDESYQRYTLLSPSKEAMGVDWFDWLVKTHWKKEYKLIENDGSYYLVKNSVSYNSVINKGARRKNNKLLNEVVPIKKADFILLSESGIGIYEKVRTEKKTLAEHYHDGDSDLPF